ncbi:MAG: hypothetical protein WC471_01910 [Candidatus Woesearchaeota archaeon]
MKTTKDQKILSDVDEEMHLLIKRIELKHNLSWAKARDAVSKSIKILFA